VAVGFEFPPQNIGGDLGVVCGVVGWVPSYSDRDSVEHPIHYGSIPGGSIFSTPKHPYQRSRATSYLISNCSFSLGVQQPRREADNSPPSIAEVKNEQKYIPLTTCLRVLHRENFHLNHELQVAISNFFYLKELTTRLKFE